MMRAKRNFAKRAEIAEKELHYQVIPIRKLIAVQLESGMLVADYLQKTSLNVEAKEENLPCFHFYIVQ